MTSTAGDSHSTPADVVHRSTASLHVGNDNEGDVGEDQDNVDALRNPVKLPEIDLLGLGNDEVKCGGATYETTTEKSKSDAPISTISTIPPISPDLDVIEDENHGAIYDFPPGLSILNVNGKPKFEIVTVRDNGRLQMFMEPNLSPQLVRSPGRNGRLKMWLLNDGELHGGGTALPPVRRSI